MVKQITQFVTNSGKVFDNESAAEQYERDTNIVSGIECIFPNSDHLSGGDFYRIPKHMIDSAKYTLAGALEDRYDPDLIKSFMDGTSNRLGRYLDDSDSPFYSVWGLFDRIDDQGRMFSQPFFVHNPDKAENEVVY